MAKLEHSEPEGVKTALVAICHIYLEEVRWCGRK